MGLVAWVHINRYVLLPQTYKRARDLEIGTVYKRVYACMRMYTCACMCACTWPAGCTCSCMATYRYVPTAWSDQRALSGLLETGAPAGLYSR